MRKKVIIGLICLICVGSTCLTSCMKEGVDGKDGINGVDGAAGKDGVSIVGITKTNTSGNVDTYTITYSDGSTSTFTVTNGTDGSQGIQGIQGEKGDDGHTPVITIGSNGDWYVDGTDTGIAAKGEKGEDGKTYEAVVSIEKTGTNGNVDTYTITYADGKTYSFTVTNGEDGIQGIQGNPGTDGHTPVITIGSNGNWYVDGVDTGKSARGEKGEQGDKGETGDKGDTGKSAYELYKEAHPEYTGSEEEWLDDLASGKLRKIVISFNTDGGTLIDNITTSFGSYIQVESPTKSGYEFVGWNLNGSLIDINTYVFMASCTLIAQWKEADTVKITFDPNGGVVVPGNMDVIYGKEYTLPTPSKKYQTFSGWKYESTSIPLTGTWDYTHNSITLTAQWTAPKIYVDLSVDAEYGTVDTTRVTISEGDYYTLPVPSSIKTDYTFYGWYLGDERVTDEYGKSLGICEWSTTTQLTASYYVKISNIYQFMKLGGQDLEGNYLVTEDLDFKGLGVNAITSFNNGVFDFGNHTLSNFVLLSGATSSSPSGIFKNMDQTASVKNLTIKNASCNQEYSSAIVGVLSYKSTTDTSKNKTVSVSNIKIVDSFNTTMRSLIVGNVDAGSAGSNYYNFGIDGVTILNSGSNSAAYVIYERKSSSSSYMGDTHYYGHGITLKNINIDNKSSSNVEAGVIYTTGCHRYYKNSVEYSTIGEIIVSGLRLNAKVKYGICKQFNNVYSSVLVENSIIYSDTEVAWGYVFTLTNCANYGNTSLWGAWSTSYCVDLGGERKKYLYQLETDCDENITNSVNLYPDANGAYTYFSNDGNEGQVTDASLIDSNFFTSFLGFDETIWDLKDIDVANGKYPDLLQN